MPSAALISAIETIPAGAWAVGVSGGADSVALLCLLAARADLSLLVVHLDHQTRGIHSTGDAEFVRQLAGKLKLPATVALRTDVEAIMTDLPANTSSRYRAVRHALFRQAVREHQLAGVILAHHADDQTETVMQRLLRGSGAMGLAAMRPCASLDDLRIVRPLLGVGRAALRQFLLETGQSWREDASNESGDYLRNRIRRLLAGEPALSRNLFELGEACHALRDWVRSAAPALAPAFATGELADLPEILATESARQWLIQRGARPDKLTPESTVRLIEMTRDAASASRAHFPGRILVRRKGGKITT
jgi:tRNA(Ile)-lysidine synthase